MELIVFPVPVLCDYLTTETKQKVFLTTDKDEQNSKIPGFFDQVDSMWDEMKWQKRLRQRPWLYWFNSNISLWSGISFNLAVMINLLIVLFYPFNDQIASKLRPFWPTIIRSLNLWSEIDFKWNFALWVVFFVSAVVLKLFPNQNCIRIFLALSILRSKYSLGIKWTIFLLGISNVLTDFLTKITNLIFSLSRFWTTQS